ncbi:DUF3365 domain-containing protein [Chryseobacterium sp. MFBS3-17]|uniref:Tll0287-like domain-containing protein n=1 Tax=Chryseobacterium sp. MFBS3-17 TaxID=2886689 RepID=UPI001D0E8680|nr:DUF3365 domain-containing protein [Chryseobacterium sp. MFBS3-17]MCC2590249.1 DUF3365 domain-containing protein [Chryseobacterium sp. MFBS3-17]
MRKLIKILSMLPLAVVLLSCHENMKPISAEENKAMMETGSSISAETQNILLLSVAQAIKEGGPAHAVEFCNIAATPLTDSISAIRHTQIHRLSDKNRNPDNAIRSEDDRDAWQRIQSGEEDFINQNHQGEVYYYKAIHTQLPACLQCHGTETDISPETREAIAGKYPHDKAIGYLQGDLRGMWKIKLK